MRLDVLILHMDADVKDIVTAAITHVMYPQAVEPLQQVNHTFLIDVYNLSLVRFLMSFNKKYTVYIQM